MRIPDTAPSFEAVLHAMAAGDPAAFRKILTADIPATVDSRYRHWAKLRHLQPPEGLTNEQWWWGIKLARKRLWRPLPLRDAGGAPFQYGMTDEALAMIHEIDRNASGSIAISEQVTSPETRDRYLVSSLIEEAITSSQLEGAATTARVAREMIRSGRRPKDPDERMILNNYRGIRAIRGFAGPLTPERVCELHRIMTEGTLDVPEAAGRLRKDNEYRVVKSPQDEILHHPPPAGELGERMVQMCEFANATSSTPFVHPVIRSILLHFWLAYDHPFVDGNGRTARALFYWSMLSHGYWLCEYVSISSILRKAPATYARAFLYSESDDNDATYFVLNQLSVIQRAIRALHRYLQKKAAEIREVERLFRKSAEFNHRQMAVLSHALRHPDMRYTIHSHRTSHNVVYETARTDLLRLADRGLLRAQKHGRTYHFYPVDDLAARLAGP